MSNVHMWGSCATEPALFLGAFVLGVAEALIACVVTTTAAQL